MHANIYLNLFYHKNQPNVGNHTIQYHALSVWEKHVPKEIKKSWTILEVKVEEWRVKRRVCFFVAAALDGGKTKQLLPRNLTWNLQNDGFQEELPFLGGLLYLLFRFHIKFRGVYILGWWSQRFFMFTPWVGEMIQFDEHPTYFKHQTNDPQKKTKTKSSWPCQTSWSYQKKYAYIYIHYIHVVYYTCSFILTYMNAHIFELNPIGVYRWQAAKGSFSSWREFYQGDTGWRFLSGWTLFFLGVGVWWDPTAPKTNTRMTDPNVTIVYFFNLHIG